MLRRRRRIADLGAGNRLTGTFVQLAVLTATRVPEAKCSGEHPVEVIVAAFHDPLGIPPRHVLLLKCSSINAGSTS